MAFDEDEHHIMVYKDEFHVNFYCGQGSIEYFLVITRFNVFVSIIFILMVKLFFYIKLILSSNLLVNIVFI